MRMVVRQAIVLALSAACSNGDPAPSPGPPAPAPARATRRMQRSLEAAELRAALDRGGVEEARSRLGVLQRLGPGSAAEAKLLSARYSALAGSVIDAIRTIEAARREHPEDPDVYATAAEIYAVAGKLDAAWDEVRSGEAICGRAPELLRARGVVWISRSGGARKGLEFLEEARRADPDLPFVDRALSQAHLLVGKEEAAARGSARALLHARQAAALDPDDVEVRRFLAEALAANGDFEGGIGEVAALVERGEPLTAELALLHKKAGIASLLARDRATALRHFAAARRLGASDEELSTGARILAEESAAVARAGVEAYQSGDLDAAKDSFRRALELEPDSIEAQNHLAVVLFKESDYPGAVALWRSVLAIAAREDLELPEPVHVNLAKAQALDGDLAGARDTLETYLGREPEGRWSCETRAALSALPARKSTD